MTKLCAICVLAFATVTLHAQKGKSDDQNLPAFGKVAKSELEMKECSFDDKAEAMILVDDAQLDYVYGSGMEMKRRMRIKILSDKGMEWANVHLPYLSMKGEEDINSLEAVTYNIDASGAVIGTKVDKKLIYEKKLNKRWTEKVFTFPEVKVGSIIEYKYKHTGIGLSDWYFQNKIPVKYSRYAIDFPEEIDVRVIPSCSRTYDRKTSSSGRRNAQIYSMSDVPAFHDEPYIINEDFYRDHISTKVVAYEVDGMRKNQLANWIQVIKFLMEDEDFGIQLKKNIPRTADLDAKLRTVNSPYEKMKTIYKYVQANMQWNEYTGIWAFDGVKSAWKDKKGTLGEINLILVNLLKDADLDAHPVLVSTHSNGLVNTGDAGTYSYPGFHQFNKVMAYVTIDEKPYVLDATQKETPVHLIPADVLMTEGLVIEKIDTYEWGWRTLWDDKIQTKNVIISKGFIDESGKLTCDAAISSFDYARLDRLGTVKKGKDTYIEKYVSSANSSYNVEDVTFENVDSDSLPLVQNVKFTQTLNSSGDYRYFSTNILSGLEKNPFVADNRTSDIFFGANQSYLLLGNFTLPDGYELEALPKNVKMIMPDTSIVMSRISQLSGNILMTKIQLDFREPVYAAAQYGEFQEFYKQLFDLINEQYVIRKKK